MELYLPWTILSGNGGWKIKDARGKCVAMHIPSRELAEIIISWVAIGTRISKERNVDGNL